MTQPPPPPQQHYGVPQPAAPQTYGAPAYSLPPQRSTSAAAVASLILGILGCIPFVTGLLAVVFGLAGLGATRNGKANGRGMAVAGLILGVVSLIGWGAVAGGIGGTTWWALAQTRPARAAARQLATDLAAGNVQAARAQCTDDVSDEQLKKAAEAMKGWGAFQDTTMPVNSRNTAGGVEAIESMGAARFAGAGTMPYAVRVVKENGQWKVEGFEFIDPESGTLGGGNAPNAADMPEEQQGRQIE